MKLSIVIPCYNELDSIDILIDKLIKILRNDIEVILVDNGSTDGTYDKLENLNLNVTNHSSNKKNLKKTDIYIVDTFGETKKFHKIACSVFLGGSIINRGGQNPLEAARYGAKILHGANVNNFKDVYKTLSKLKISKKITTSNDMASAIIFKRNKSQGNRIKKIGVKILKETINNLDKLINNEFKKT